MEDLSMFTLLAKRSTTLNTKLFNKGVLLKQIYLKHKIIT